MALGLLPGFETGAVWSNMVQGLSLNLKVAFKWPFPSGSCFVQVISFFINLLTLLYFVRLYYVIA